VGEYSGADWGSEYLHLITESCPFITGPVHRHVLPLPGQGFGVVHIVVKIFRIGREMGGHVICENRLSDRHAI